MCREWKMYQCGMRSEYPSINQVIKHLIDIYTFYSPRLTFLIIAGAPNHEFLNSIQTNGHSCKYFPGTSTVACGSKFR